MAGPWEVIADYACVTGEGPLYHPDENVVYWTDIPQGRLFRYDLTTGSHEAIYDGEPVGGFTIQADGALLLFGARGAVRRRAPDGTLTTIIDEIADERTSRFNDVIADPQGRVFCGTMSTRERPGRLYWLNTDGTLDVVLEGVGCSNGMGFTPDGTGMYHTDSTARTISLFDYDACTGALSNQRLFVQTPSGEGVPDGMTVDAEGYVWSARWDGSCVVRYDPGGREVSRLDVPAKKASCITFGGPDYATMYVTTAGGDRKETDGPLAGSLLRGAVSGVRGVPEFRSRIVQEKRP